jgi:hypothetical protein
MAAKPLTALEVLDHAGKICPVGRTINSDVLRPSPRTRFPPSMRCYHPRCFRLHHRTRRPHASHVSQVIPINSASNVYVYASLVASPGGEVNVDGNPMSRSMNRPISHRQIHSEAGRCVEGSGKGRMSVTPGGGQSVKHEGYDRAVRTL